MAEQGLKILVSNDDGYDSPALIALADGLREFADVAVCAPLSNMSGASSSLSLAETVTVSVMDERRIVVHGTPTDCVHLALVAPGLMPWRPDLTVSGINLGNNIGDDAMYSGTIAAAAESVQLGVPSLAFSLGSVPPEHFPPLHIGDAAGIACSMVRSLKDRMLASKGTMLNVNIPDLPRAGVGRPVVCKLGMSHLRQGVEAFAARAGAGPAGPAADGGDASALTDIDAVAAGNISVTPLHFDLTDRDKIGRVAKWLKA